MMKSGQTNAIRFEKLNKDNLDSLADGLSRLYREVRGQERSREFWRWCYLENPERDSASVAAIHNDTVIGKIGGIFYRMSVMGYPLLACLFEGLAVLPSFRRWSCYSGLLQMNYVLCVEKGVSFGFSLADSKSVDMNVRLGWSLIGKPKIFFVMLDAFQALRNRSLPASLALPGSFFLQKVAGVKKRSFSNSGRITVEPLHEFNSGYDEFWMSLKADRVISIEKNSKYMNWRYIARPDRRHECLGAYLDGRLVGVIVCSVWKERREGYILELLMKDRQEDVSHILLGTALHRLHKQGIGMAGASFPQGSLQEKALKRIGFRSWAGALWRMKLIVATERSGEEAPELKPENWRFSLGDWLYY